MSAKSHRQIGVAAILFAIFLYLVGIPYGVTSPSNVQNIVLSPLFWPRILAALLALGGIGLLLTSRRLDNENHESFLGGVGGAPIRLGLMAVLMVLYVLAAPVIGMVWTSMLAFAALAFLIKTRHPVAAVLAAVFVPLILYAFFAHVAGVAIPQGDFVRLP